ncbi:MAG: SCO family protein [Methyloligellaceae bacterium]
MKQLRTILWLAVASLLIGLAVILAIKPSLITPSVNSLATRFGGPFVMTKHDGTTVTEKDLAGKPYAMFFGFTHCPEICPTTLNELTQTIAQLGADADKMNFVFVSVDPERDTQELLKDYMANFDKRIMGLTGTPEQTKAIAKAYSVYYAKVGDGPDYNMNHTASIYLMNAQGQLAGTLAHQDTDKTRLAKLKRLINNK